MGYAKTKKALTLAGAETIARAAEVEATRLGARVVIAVVDDGGKPIPARSCRSAASSACRTAGCAW